jgi:hypothetical protein
MSFSIPSKEYSSGIKGFKPLSFKNSAVGFPMAIIIFSFSSFIQLSSHFSRKLSAMVLLEKTITS